VNQRYIALLRAVNVAGKNRLAMADLRSFLQKLGCRNVSTYVQSGNAVFSADEVSTSRLEARMEAEAGDCLGLNIDFLIRDEQEWKSIISLNPYARMGCQDPSHLIVMALKSNVSQEAFERLQDATQGGETAALQGKDGKNLYLTYPDGIGRARLTSTVIERILGMRGTARNWNTVVKLAALAELL
jgi:uncharacterized protein (DUF1697 family)